MALRAMNWDNGSRKVRHLLKTFCVGNAEVSTYYVMGESGSNEKGEGWRGWVTGSGIL
jgi:hypothetical protein